MHHGKTSNKKILAILIIILVIFVGILIDIYWVTNTAQNLRARIKIDNFDIETSAGVIPKSIIIDLRIDIDNPTDHEFEAHRIYFNVYIEDHYLTEISKENVYIPPKKITPVDFSMEIKSNDIINIVKNIVKDIIEKGDRRIKYEIQGKVEIPIKLFGVLPLFNLEIPINISGYYTIPLLGRMNIEASAIWQENYICVGDEAHAEVTIRGPLNGYVSILIMKDKAFMPDVVAERKDLGYIKIEEYDEKNIELTFTPDEPSSTSMRGYYIAIEVNNSILWKQEESYPPRLKVNNCAITTIPVNIQSIEWYVNGYLANEARYGDHVECVIWFTTDRPQVSGYLTVEILRDKRALPDELVIRKDYYITIKQGETQMISIDFIISDTPSWSIRGYYVKIYFNNELIYEMPSSYPPRLKLGS